MLQPEGDARVEGIPIVQAGYHGREDRRMKGAGSDQGAIPLHFLMVLIQELQIVATCLDMDSSVSSIRPRLLTAGIGSGAGPPLRTSRGPTKGLAEH